ncbi:DUF2277 family protein [Micromonospora sp. M12]
MCRSIKTLREPFTPQVTEADVEAAALQYVRKISGFRAPAAHNAAAFDAAVATVAEATRTLLDQLVVRGAGSGTRTDRPPPPTERRHGTRPAGPDPGRVRPRRAPGRLCRAPTASGDTATSPDNPGHPASRA